MSLKGLYPYDLWKIIKNDKKYIPRQLRKDEKLKLYRRYWLSELGMIKVKEIISIQNREFYSITYGNNGEKNGVISYPVEFGCYELLKNFNEFEKSDFINKKKPIYGAEIKYWFIINNIDFSDENYSGFLDKLQYLKDSAKYIVRRNKKKQEYEFVIKK